MRERKRAKSTKKSLRSFGALMVTKSLHCFTGLRPVLAVGKTIHTPTQPLSLLLGKAGRGCVCIISTCTPPTSEPRFELEAAGVSIEVRPVLDKSICRAEAAVQENVGPMELF